MKLKELRQMKELGKEPVEQFHQSMDESGNDLKSIDMLLRALH